MTTGPATADYKQRRASTAHVSGAPGGYCLCGVFGVHAILVLKTDSVCVKLWWCWVEYMCEKVASVRSPLADRDCRRSYIAPITAGNSRVVLALLMPPPHNAGGDSLAVCVVLSTAWCFEKEFVVRAALAPLSSSLLIATWDLLFLSSRQKWVEK